MAIGDVPADARNVGLDDKVAFLSRPENYPEPTSTVESRETHMSWVFLTDRYAYKLKKAIRLPFLDFSTIALRKWFCEEELRLNRRLAPRVYIHTLPMTMTDDGMLALAGTGAAIDWLVKMHRLPADMMLDQMIRRKAATANDIDRFARRISDFYREAPPVDMTASDYRRRFETDIASNLRELKTFAGILPLDQVERLHIKQSAFLRESGEMFDRRIRERRIVEAHGDLRPEHILLGPEPQVIDCLEFNREFRLLDPADELAFLAVECEMLGAAEIGVMLMDRYREQTADDPPSRLLDFYKCYRACLRAKIAVWHLRETPMRTPARWPALGRRYLDLADGYAARL